MKLFCILSLREVVAIEVPATGQQVPIAIKWHDGMVGAFPVFGTLEEAQAVCPNTDFILEVNYPDKVLN